MPTVDIVIPCYNYGRYLRDCVASAVAQSGVTVRVLIINACSQDDTPSTGSELCESDGRVTFRTHDVNKGHIVTYCSTRSRTWIRVPDVH